MSSRVALVTGGNRGIGAAVVAGLQADGWTVAGTSRSGDCPGADAAYTLDVVDGASVDACIDAVLEAHGRIDALVNNAGSAKSAKLSGTGDALWEEMIGINLTGTFRMMRGVIPHMIEAGSGRVVNIASTAALVGAPYISAYAAAKHGVMGLTRSVALEVAGRGITVNAVCPSYVDTDMTERTVTNIVEKTGKTPDEARAILEGMNPQGRMLAPEEVAAAVRYLVSDAASGINGQAITLDGGETAG